MKFNENLKYLRKESKLTQENLAEKLNVSRQAVTKWESGQSLPDIDNLKQMADLFGVTMDSLVGDIETKKESKINKKMNDIGYFIIAVIVLLFPIFFSIQAFIEQLTSNENIIIVTSILVVGILFIFFLLSIKLYFKEKNNIIINMKQTKEGKKERIKYILNKLKFELFDFAIYGIISKIEFLPKGFDVYFINVAKWLFGSFILILVVEFIDYLKLENKVKKINENQI